MELPFQLPLLSTRELYTLVIVVVIAIILMSGSVEIALLLVAVLTAAVYKITEPIIEPMLVTPGPDEQGFAENNLLEPYLTPEQRSAYEDREQPFAAAPTKDPAKDAGKNTKSPTKGAGKTAGISKKPAAADCAELLEMLDSRTDDGNVNYLCHAKRKFRGREPRKTTTRDTIMRWVEEEPVAEENRHWWGAYEQ